MNLLRLTSLLNTDYSPLHTSGMVS